jgi:hypothetical protein
MRASITSTALSMILAAAMMTPTWAAGPMAHGPKGVRPTPPHNVRIVHRHPNQLPRGNVVPRLGTFSGYVPYAYFPYGYLGDDGYYGEAASAATPDVIVAEPQSVAAPVAVAHYQPPTVETTPEGVTVVRGPGSRRPAP